MTNGVLIQFKEFNGPLDLLLSLLDEKKMGISEVAISAVTEPFLEYLDTLEEVNPQELADFLVIGAKLLFLKSKSLLPEFSVDDDEGATLEDQLRLYRLFIDASKHIDSLWLNDTKKSYGRIETPVHVTEFVPPENLTTQNLHETMLQLVLRLAPAKELPKTYIDKAVSMKEKMDSIRNLLQKGKNFTFRELLSKTHSKTELIVSFLALLELVKQRSIYIEQDEAFGDMRVGKT